jgi:hypothetical protein
MTCSSYFKLFRVHHLAHFQTQTQPYKLLRDLNKSIARNKLN